MEVTGRLQNPDVGYDVGKTGTGGNLGIAANAIADDRNQEAIGGGGGAAASQGGTFSILLGASQNYPQKGLATKPADSEVTVESKLGITWPTVRDTRLTALQETLKARGHTQPRKLSSGRRGGTEGLGEPSAKKEYDRNEQKERC